MCPDPPTQRRVPPPTRTHKKSSWLVVVEARLTRETDIPSTAKHVPLRRRHSFLRDAQVISLHRCRMRRPSAPTVASEPRCQGSVERCFAARWRCEPTQSVPDKHATSELCARTRATDLTSSVVLSSLSKLPQRSKLEGSRFGRRTFRTGTEHVAVRLPARDREALREEGESSIPTV